MTNKEEQLASFARTILGHPMYKETLEEIRTSITVGILNTNIDERQARDDSYLIWKGTEAFVAKLQSFIDRDDRDAREADEMIEALQLIEDKEQAKQDAIKDL